MTVAVRRLLASDAHHRCRVARGGAHPTQDKEVPRLHGGRVRTKRRWCIRQMQAERGETILGGGGVGGHDDSALPLPAADMRAAIDVQDMTRDRRGVGQVHACVRDLLDG